MWSTRFFSTTIHCQLSRLVFPTWIRRQFKCRPQLQFKCRLPLINSRSLHRRRTWDLITCKTISISISFSTSNPFLRSQNNPLCNSFLNNSRKLSSNKSNRSNSKPRNSQPSNSQPSQNRLNNRLRQRLRRLSLHLRLLHLRHHICLQMCTTRYITQEKTRRTYTTALSINRCLSMSPSQE